MLSNKTIVIIGAMDCELEGLNAINRTFSNIIIAKSGVGKVASASCTQKLIDKYAPDYIINTGVAGGIGSGLKIGDVVIADSFVYHDFDATALGYAKGYICNGIENQKPTIFYPNKSLSDTIKNSAIKTLSAENVHTGLIASGDMFVASIEKKKEIRETFNAIAAEMEGASIAHTATLNNIPFVAIRAISDLADGTKIENYPEFEIKASKISVKIIENFLESLC